MKVERPYAYCCAQGGGDPKYCDCVNKQHGSAIFDVRDEPAPAKATVNCFGIPDVYRGWTIKQGPDDRWHVDAPAEAETWEELCEEIDAFVGATPKTPPAASSGQDLRARVDAEIARITGWHPAKALLEEIRPLLALLSAPAVQPGGDLVVVPAKMTREMKDAALAYMMKHCPHRAKETAWDMVSAWPTVLTAATPQPEAEEGA